jgi:hypothetical protein
VFDGLGGMLLENLGEVVVGEGEAVGYSGDRMEGEEARYLLEDDGDSLIGVYFL